MIDTDLSSLKYTAKPQQDQIKLSYNGNDLTEDDCQIVVKSGLASFDNYGKYTLEICAKEDRNFTGSIIVPATIQKANIADFSCNISSPEYTGKALKPSFTLTGSDDVEISASNYSVAYKNNTKVGTGTITLTGKGNLQGRLVKDFTIAPKPIDKNDLTVSLAAATYSPKGTPIKTTVKYGKATLKQGVDYNVILKQNDNSVTSADIQAGDYDAYIDLIGNYTEKDGEMAKKQSSVAKYKIPASKVVTSIDITKKAIVTYIDGKYATEDVDYVVDSIINSTTKAEIENNDSSLLEPGVKYDITISLLGNYDCTKTTKNLVGKINISQEDTVITLAAQSYTYNGKAIKPAITKVVAGGNTLKKSDYIVTYSDNINTSGTPKVTIKGKGIYTGEASVSFTIVKATVKETAIKYKKDLTFNNKEQTVYIAVGKLKSGTDYFVNDNTQKNAGSYNATLTLSDNFQFEAEQSTISLPYTINKANITSVKASNGYLFPNADSVTPPVTVKAGNITLSPDDYIIDYSNNTVLTTAKSKASATLSSLNSDNYNLPAKEAARTSTFTITKENISKATVSGLANKTYTGESLTYDAESDTVSIKTSTGTYKVIANGVVDSDNFTVAYSNNIKPGKGKIKITAKPDSFLTGTKTLNYVIEKGNFADLISYKDKDDEWPFYEYTGKPIGKENNIINDAELKDKVTNTSLSVNKLSYYYENDTNAGYGRIIIMPGKYSNVYFGSITVEFPIQKISLENCSIDYKKTVYVPEGWEPETTRINTEIYSVTVNGNNLKKNRDYTVSYRENLNTGLACFTIAGRGNYTGRQSFYFRIVK